jgi:hypothetical protein
MYRAYGLLKPNNDFNLTLAFNRLTEAFPGYQVTRTDEQITVAKGDWDIVMSLATGPHIPEETQGITDRIAGLERVEVEELIASNTRIEIASETPDPFMEHFNDFLKVVEVLKSFRGVLAVDPHERALL